MSKTACAMTVQRSGEWEAPTGCSWGSLWPLLLATVFVMLAALRPVAAEEPPLTFTHLAGSLGGPGFEDGARTAARLQNPWGVAFDGAGALYVGDCGNRTIRRVVVATGEITTIAGMAGSWGSADGVGEAARFSCPTGLAFDGAGNLFVTDYGTIRRVVVATREVTTIAGKAGSYGSSDGAGSAARFAGPIGVAFDGSGHLFVADSGNSTIRRVVIETGEVTTVAGQAGSTGGVDGVGRAATFAAPSGLAFDGAGNLYVTDRGNYTIRKIVVATGEVRTIAGEAGSLGSADGVGGAARFGWIYGVAFDGSGSLYVPDYYNDAIRKVVVATGEVTTIAGQAGSTGGVDGVGPAAQFNGPIGAAFDGQGSLYVADHWNHAIRKVIVAPREVVTTTGQVTSPGASDGVGTGARFDGVHGAAYDGAGSLFVADSNNHTIRRVVVATGEVTTIAGQAGSAGKADGVGNAARFNYPSGVALDGIGNIYVADQFNNSVRKVVAATGEVTTISDYRKGLAANPIGVAFDGSGTLFVSSYFATVQKVVIATGEVAELAGQENGWGSADGVGSAARFNMACGLAYDGQGTLYVADSWNNHTIRKVVVGTGDVTTLAGMAGSPGASDGTGSAARFYAPYGVTLNAAGDLVVADTWNDTIRRVAVSTGEVTTTVGQAGMAGGSDFTGMAVGLNRPYAVACSGSGDLFVAEDYAIRWGAPGLADHASIDAATGPVGQPRQLGTSPQTATSWSWEVVRRPAGSVAQLSSLTVRDPIFTPDVADLFTFRLTASNGARESITLVDLKATPLSPCGPPSAFELVAPAAGATNVSAAPTFAWTPSSGAGTYTVHFGTTNPPSVDNDVVVPGTSFSPSVALQPGTTCYWSVEAAASCDPAQRTANTGGVRSFTTVPPLPDCVATRNLPTGYVPRLVFQVSIAVTPPTGSQSWSLNDGPPAGWIISNIADGGAFNAARGRVEWGPFADAAARTVSYSVTPATDAVATYSFSGAVSVDGMSQVTCGPHEVQPLKVHWIPSVAHAPGAGTSKWRSNIVVANRSGSVANLSLAFIPYSSGSTVTKSYALANDATVEWADVLVSLFGVADSASTKGTFKITSDVSVIAIARTFNQADTGTFGQEYPALVDSQSMTSGQIAVLPMLKKNSGFRTNIGLQNLGAASCTGTVKLYNASGTQVGSTRTLTAGVDRYIQDDDVFAKAGAGTQDVAYALVEVTTSGGEAWFYASVIDASTNDPTTVPMQPGSPTGPFWVPSVAHAPGVGTSKWRSNIAVVNRSGSTANLSLAFVPYSSGSTVTKSYALANGAAVEWADVLVSLFEVADSASTKGSVKITSDVPVVAIARTYNQAAAGTFGQGYPALVDSQSMTSGQIAVLPMLKKNSSFRTNSGLQNLGATSCTGTVKLYNGSGTQVGSTRTLTAAADKYIQDDDVFAKAGAGTQDVAYAIVEVTTSGGKAWFYASVIDASTNDPTTIEALVP